MQKIKKSWTLKSQLPENENQILPSHNQNIANFSPSSAAGHWNITLCDQKFKLKTVNWRLLLLELPIPITSSGTNSSASIRLNLFKIFFILKRALPKEPSV